MGAKGEMNSTNQFIGSLLLAALAGLTGCTGPSSSAPDAFAGLSWPQQFSDGQTKTPAGAGWLTDFNDRTLEALVQEALANNPDLRVTAAKLDAAQAALRIAGADLTPSLTLKAATSRVKRNNTSGFSITSSRTERYTPSMDLAWELDIWGRLRDSQFSSRMDAEQAAANLQAARLSLAANTAKGWFDLAETELQTQLAIQTHQSYTNNLAVLEEGLQRGLTKALDVRLMRTSARNAESTLLQRQRERDASRRSRDFAGPLSQKRNRPEHRPTHAD